MTPDQFRKLALELPESAEDAHHQHPDFRIAGKVFATLAPDGTWGMVKLNPDDQPGWIADDPDVFEPAPGAWGRNGATKVWLKRAKVALVRKALLAAWRNVAPKKLLRELDAGAD